MQDKDVMTFKFDLRAYPGKKAMVKYYEEQIEQCYDILGGVRGVDPSREPLHALPDKDMEYAVRDRIEELEDEIEPLNVHIEYVERILARMEPTLRWAVIEVYCKRNTIASVARKLFLSHNGLARRIDKGIKKALY